MELVPVVVQVQLERPVTQDRLVPRDSLDQVDVQETLDLVDNQVKWEWLERLERLVLLEQQVRHFHILYTIK